MRFNRRSRWLIFLVLMYFAFSMVAGISLADRALHPGRRPLTDEEAFEIRAQFAADHIQLQDVALTAKDDVTLRGWILRPPQPNGEAAILLHGLGDNRLGMVGYARLLLTRGYSILLPDARAHGASGGEFATYGLIERDDIRAWVDLLRAQTQAPCIYGMGESMGAAQLLQSLQAGAKLCAVIAESSFSTFREIAYDRMGQPFHMGPWVGRTILRPLVEIAFLRARWKYGFNMNTIAPEEAVSQAHAPVLLIHGEIDSNIPVRHSQRIHALNPQTALWEVPHADHCGAISAAPEEFERRVISWMDGSKQATFPAAALAARP